MGMQTDANNVTDAGTSASHRDSGARGGRSGVAAAVRWLVGRRLSGLVAAIAITMVGFYLLNSYFFAPGNLLHLVRSASSLAILAFGETLVLLTGEIDLSVGSTYGLAAMIAGLMWQQDYPVEIALLAGLAGGALVGLANGLITTKIRVNSFITTLGMLNLVMGLTFLISNSRSINPSSELPGYGTFEILGGLTLPLGIPVQIVWLVVIGVAMWFLVHRTLLGFRMAAIGGNPVAAKVVHLPIDRYKILVFVICGMCAGLAGLMDFSFVGETGPTSGSSLPFTVFAAVIIGGASLSGGRGTIVGTLVGALFLTMVTNGLALLGVGAYGQFIMVGFIIIAAVAIDQWTTGRASQATQF